MVVKVILTRLGAGFHDTLDLDPACILGRRIVAIRTFAENTHGGSQRQRHIVHHAGLDLVQIDVRFDMKGLGIRGSLFNEPFLVTTIDSRYCTPTMTSNPEEDAAVNRRFYKLLTLFCLCFSDGTCKCWYRCAL